MDAAQEHDGGTGRSDLPANNDNIRGFWWCRWALLSVITDTLGKALPLRNQQQHGYRR
jgi:hypothetical protein